jgi:hypothetical protein
MSVPDILLLAALACAAGAVASAVSVTAALDRRGTKTPFSLIGALLFRNLVRYRDATRDETGRAGGLFYGYVVSVNAALILATAAALLRMIAG